MKNKLFMNRSLGEGLLSCFISLAISTISIFSYHLESQEVFSLKKKGETHKRIDVTNFFHPTKLFLTNETIITDPIVLQKAAASTLRHFKSKKINKQILSPRIFSQKIITPYQTKMSLEFIVSTIEHDKKHKKPFRIIDPNFLEKNFKFFKWYGDVHSAKQNKVKISSDKIRLTNYAVFVLNGNYQKTKNYPYALYNIIDKDFEKIDRFKYTKQDILDNAMHNTKNKNRVKPMVWLSKDDLETAMMQGTAYVKMPDNKKRLFVVDKNNGFAYDKKIKEPSEQKRYWYFSEIKNPKYFNKKGVHLNHGGAVFAGDIYNIGLGKIIAIKYQNPVNKKEEMRLGILADSGSALINNLYQLDLFAGIFDNKNEFKNWLRQMPNAVEAYILVKK